MADQIKFSPAIPIPLVFDIPERIQHLRDCLDPKSSWYQREQQHVNIRAIIKLYEEGKIDGVHEVWVMEGKVVTEKEAINGTAWAWTEGMRYQLAQKHIYGQGPFGPHFHELRMLLRLIPHRGGDGTVHGIIAMNDTGSDILSLFHSDLQQLGNMQEYTGWYGDIGILSANGMRNIYPMIIVEVQMVRYDNTSWTDWIQEVAIVKPDGPGLPRLSGYGIRRVLYLGTSPGNHSLAAATTKGGLTSLL